MSTSTEPAKVDIDTLSGALLLHGCVIAGLLVHAAYRKARSLCSTQSPSLDVVAAVDAARRRVEGVGGTEVVKFKKFNIVQCSLCTCNV